MADLAPFMKQQFFDDNGDPLSGGLIYVYNAGTTTPKDTFTDASGDTNQTNPIVLDAAGRTEIWITSGYYKFVVCDSEDVELYTIDNVSLGAEGGGATGVPDGGDTGALLAKASSTAQDLTWDQHAYSGYSSRFNEAFSSTNLTDTINKILDLSYVPPSISFSASGQSTTREKGDAVTSSTLTANVTKTTDDISEVRFYQGATLLDKQNSGGAIPSGGSNTYSWSGSFSDNTTFKAEADDNGASGGPTTVSASRTFNFVYPYYVGADSASLAAASVAGLTKRIISSTSNRSESITAGAGEVFYFAYPASYGALTSILDENNFETIGDWTLRTENITGLDGNAVSYRIYEFNNTVTAGSYTYTFKR